MVIRLADKRGLTATIFPYITLLLSILVVKDLTYDSRVGFVYNNTIALPTHDLKLIQEQECLNEDTRETPHKDQRLDDDIVL